MPADMETTMNPAEVRAALEANLSLNATLERLGLAYAEEYSVWQWILEVVDVATGEVIQAGTERHLWSWLRGLAGEEVRP